MLGFVCDLGMEFVYFLIFYKDFGFQNSEISSWDFYGYTLWAPTNRILCTHQISWPNPICFNQNRHQEQLICFRSFLLFILVGGMIRHSQLVSWYFIHRTKSALLDVATGAITRECTQDSIATSNRTWRCCCKTHVAQQHLFSAIYPCRFELKFKRNCFRQIIPPTNTFVLPKRFWSSRSFLFVVRRIEPLSCSPLITAMQLCKGAL